jgi:hypothetical protein
MILLSELTAEQADRILRETIEYDDCFICWIVNNDGAALIQVSIPKD